MEISHTVEVYAETGENSAQDNCSPKSASKRRGGHNVVGNWRLWVDLVGILDLGYRAAN